jgi:hypothetical protein
VIGHVLLSDVIPSRNPRVTQRVVQRRDALHSKVAAMFDVADARRTSSIRSSFRRIYGVLRFFPTTHVCSFAYSTQQRMRLAHNSSRLSHTESLRALDAISFRARRRLSRAARPC